MDCGLGSHMPILAPGKKFLASLTDKRLTTGPIACPVCWLNFLGPRCFQFLLWSRGTR